MYPSGEKAVIWDQVGLARKAAPPPMINCSHCYCYKRRKGRRTLKQLREFSLLITSFLNLREFMPYWKTPVPKPWIFFLNYPENQYQPSFLSHPLRPTTFWIVNFSNKFLLLNWFIWIIALKKICLHSFPVKGNFAFHELFSKRKQTYISKELLTYLDSLKRTREILWKFNIVFCTICIF